MTASLGRGEIAEDIRKTWSVPYSFYSLQTCAGCGGTMRIIACIEDPVVIKAILAHRANKARPVHAVRLPPGRAPPGPVVS
jgi:hypothetical protein